MEHLASSIDPRIAGKTPADSWPLLATRNIPLSPTIQNPVVLIRNQNCWLSDIDSTCVLLGNNYNGINANPPNNSWPNTFGLNGVLITPKHVLFAKHNTPRDIGIFQTKVYFLDKNGSIVEKIVVDYKDVRTIKNDNGIMREYSTDFTVCALNEIVPNTINPVKVFKEGYKINFSHFDYSPCVRLNLLKEALTGEVNHLESNFYDYVFCTIRQTSNLLPFYKPVVGEDSGSPGFFIVNNRLVLFTTWHNGGSGSGPNASIERNFINEAISNLGGTYQLEETNIDQFSAY